MKEIQLTQRRLAKVDDADFYDLLARRWSTCRNRATGKSYAVTSIDGKNTTMHRYLMGVTDPRVHVDHINGDGLDNQRSNLRLATASQNHANKGRRAHNTSGYKGVHFTKRRAHLKTPWAAYLSPLKETRFLGYFETAESAAKAYDKAAFDFYGEYARLNFPLVSG